MYTPKNILITGGAGFIGKAVANYLYRKYKYNIVVVDILNYCSTLYDLDKNILFIRANICNKNLMEEIISKFNIDTIMHFAAQTHVDNSFNNSLEFTEANVYGTHVLAQVAVDTKVKRFIHVSTDEVYGEQSLDLKSGCKEEHTLNPTNPYAATKCGAEFIIKSYQTSYNLPAIITRSNNVYGPGQYPEKLIPCFIMNLMKGEQLPVHGEGNTLRNFIYIDDEVNCFDNILHHGITGNIYNISGNDEYSVMDVTKILCEKFNVNPRDVVKHVGDRNFNDKRYFIDNTNLIMLYNSIGKEFKLTPFNEGLDKTISWYKQHGNYAW